MLRPLLPLVCAPAIFALVAAGTALALVAVPLGFAAVTLFVVVRMAAR